MHLIIPLIRSYLTLRLITLNSFKSYHLYNKNLPKIIELSQSKHYNRMKNPSNWTIDEVLTLAEQMGYSTTNAVLIKKLAMIMSYLPQDEKFSVFKKSNLDSKKLKIRNENYNNWKLIDLQKIVETENNQKNNSIRIEKKVLSFTR